MTNHQRTEVVGVDVGGTFTDLVRIETATGRVTLAKVPSTPDNQAQGVMEALRSAECDLAALQLIIHGTTTTTNAVLERKLARTGLLTTAGFRDVLELGRRTRPQPYGMTGRFEPVIPRDLRLEVPERMDAEGRVITPLDARALKAAAVRLLDAGCEAVVVHFLHSYANPVHELLAGEILEDLWPNEFVTLGHALLSESREFERGVTAAVNASVQPLLDRYLSRLRENLGAGGYGGDVLVMNGNGGMAASRSVAREAAKTVMSGPASGVMAAVHMARLAGVPNLITYDMGGTSTDVALIRNAEAPVSNEIEIEYAMPIHVPMVDVRTVGAGGGSIARVTPAGLIEVGPQSAGAVPGPICYGRGGMQPTISDANLVLGRLDPQALAAVEGGVGLDGIQKIFDETLGQPLGLDTTAAADAVLRMANTKMAGAIRMVSVSLGADPRDFALFAFGGAGPLHAAALARELGIPRVLVPARPGITNAIGCVVADLRHDFVQTINTPLDAMDETTLTEVFAAQTAEGTAMIAAESVKTSGIHAAHSVEMQFVGQTHLLRVPVPDPRVSADDLRAAFDEVYYRRFKVALPEGRANVVNANTSVVGARPPLDLSTLIDPASRAAEIKGAWIGSRPVFFAGSWHDTPVYKRETLPLDVQIEGPAVIEQMDTTILVEPGDTVTGDDLGNLHIHVGANA